MALSTDVIFAALQKDPDALEQVLKYYERYVDSQSTESFLDEHGIRRTAINEDMKVTVQSKLIMALQKFDVERALTDSIKDQLQIHDD